MAWFEKAAWRGISAGRDGSRTDKLVPCSAGGICDESTGICNCRSNIFTGNDCAVMACPTCSDAGTCRDMEYIASVSSASLLQMHTNNMENLRSLRYPPHAMPSSSDFFNILICWRTDCIFLFIMSPSDSHNQRRGYAIHIQLVGCQQNTIMFVQPLKSG